MYVANVSTNKLIANGQYMTKNYVNGKGHKQFEQQNGPKINPIKLFPNSSSRK